MSRYIDADRLIDDIRPFAEYDSTLRNKDWVRRFEVAIDAQPPADVVEVDKAQKEIDYWHDKAQSYEQTILKLSLNKADVVEVVRCKDCKHLDKGENDSESWCECTRIFGTYFDVSEDDYCSYGERADT